MTIKLLLPLAADRLMHVHHGPQTIAAEYLRNFTVKMPSRIGFFAVDGRAIPMFGRSTEVEYRWTGDFDGVHPIFTVDGVWHR